MRKRLLIVLVAVMAVLDIAPAYAQSRGDDRIEVAQEQRRRTLFDLLFGEEQKPAPPPVQRQQPRQQVAAPPPPPPPPVITKNADATRLAVFGDSLAIDLARALERFYAEDPNLLVINQGVSSAGFVRYDFFNWEEHLRAEISKDSFDVAVVSMGINDRQELTRGTQTYATLSAGWTAAYQERLNGFIGILRSARKPVIWLGLPPMEKSEYSADISQINTLQRLAAFSGGAEFIDIYDRFLGEDGRYAANGPDLNGQAARMRKDDGIHFASAGADKLAFYISQSLTSFYRGGSVTLAAFDPLAGTDAGALLRPPFQGLGQTRLLEVAGAVLPLSRAPQRASALIDNSQPSPSPSFTLEQLMSAPKGRVDDFGVGLDPSSDAAIAPETL